MQHTRGTGALPSLPLAPWLCEHPRAHLGTRGLSRAPTCERLQPCTAVQTRRCALTHGVMRTCVCPVHVCVHTREFWAVGCTHVCAQRMGPHWERVWVGSTRVGWHVLCPGTTRWCPASVSPFGDIKLHPAQGHGGVHEETPPSMPGRAPCHSQGRATATVTPACASTFLEKIKVVDQHLGGTGGGGFAAGGALVAGKQAQLREALGSMYGLGGWASPRCPIVSTYFGVSMAPSL